MVEPYSKIGLTIVMYKESRVEEEEYGKIGDRLTPEAALL